jgi:hypothetical protein
MCEFSRVVQQASRAIRPAFKKDGQGWAEHEENNALQHVPSDLLLVVAPTGGVLLRNKELARTRARKQKERTNNTNMTRKSLLPFVLGLMGGGGAACSNSSSSNTCFVCFKGEKTRR